MIDSFRLLPERGRLRGGNITLDLQVRIHQYRADFLVNEGLVVEIDGAAYHSSDEAIQRDGERDEFMMGLGFNILRIPAKVVFATPDEAVSRVRASLAAGEGFKRQPSRPPAGGVSKLSLGQALSSLGDFFADVNEHVRVQSAVDGATKQLKEAFAYERTIIGKALLCARQRIHDQDMDVCGYSSIAADMFATEDRLERLSWGGFTRESSRTFESVRHPPPHDDPVLDQAIRNRCGHIIHCRSQYIDEVRRRVATDPRLAPIISDYLKMVGRSELCALIAI
jgi:very-short-patch-repair endonuclease